ARRRGGTAATRAGPRPHARTGAGLVRSGPPVAAASPPRGGPRGALVVAPRHAGDDARHGAVHVIWKVENERWNRAVPITNPKECPIPVGAHLAAVHHPPGPTLEVFFVEIRGAAWSVWRRRDEPWQAAHRLTSDGLAPPS